MTPQDKTSIIETLRNMGLSENEIDDLLLNCLNEYDCVRKAKEILASRIKLNYASTKQTKNNNFKL